MRHRRGRDPSLLPDRRAWRRSLWRARVRRHRAEPRLSRMAGRSRSGRHRDSPPAEARAALASWSEAVDRRAGRAAGEAGAAIAEGVGPADRIAVLGWESLCLGPGGVGATPVRALPPRVWVSTLRPDLPALPDQFWAWVRASAGAIGSELWRWPHLAIGGGPGPWMAIGRRSGAALLPGRALALALAGGGCACAGCSSGRWAAPSGRCARAAERA